MKPDESKKFDGFQPDFSGASGPSGPTGQISNIGTAELTSSTPDQTWLREIREQIATVRSQASASKRQIDEIQNREIPTLKKAYAQTTAKNLEMLTIFVALFTFVSIQFQAFSNANRGLLVPISFVIGGALLVLISTLSLLINGWSKNEKPRNIIRILIIASGITGLALGYGAYTKYLDQQNTCPNLAQQISSADKEKADQLIQKFTAVCSK